MEPWCVHFDDYALGGKGGGVARASRGNIKATATKTSPMFEILITVHSLFPRNKIPYDSAKNRNPQYNAYRDRQEDRDK